MVLCRIINASTNNSSVLVQNMVLIYFFEKFPHIYIFHFIIIYQILITTRSIENLRGLMIKTKNN